MERSSELPDHGSIAEALKKRLLAGRNRPLSASKAYDLLATDFGLSRHQLNLKIKTANGSEIAWHNRCRTARNHLVRLGIMKREPRDSWSPTEEVFEGLKKTPEELGL